MIVAQRSSQTWSLSSLAAIMLTRKRATRSGSPAAPRSELDDCGAAVEPDLVALFLGRHHADKQHDAVDLLGHLVDELGLLFGVARRIERPAGECRDPAGRRLLDGAGARQPLLGRERVHLG